MERCSLILAVVVLVLLPIGRADAGGGSWIGLAAEPGDEVIVGGELWIAARDPGRQWIEDGPWFVWMHIEAPTQWNQVNPGDIRLGELQITRDTGGAARVRLEATVPDVQPGDYQLAVCNEGCEATLGDFVGGSITVLETTSDAVSPSTPTSAPTPSVSPPEPKPAATSPTSAQGSTARSGVVLSGVGVGGGILGWWIGRRRQQAGE